MILFFVGLDWSQDRKPKGNDDRIYRYFYGWDSGWYGHIAQHGYTDPLFIDGKYQSHLAFYPLYPLTTRAVSSAFGLSIPNAAVLNANLFHLLALVLFAWYCWIRSESWRTTRDATWLFAFCPQGIVFACGYTESLFVLLTLAALLSFEAGRYYRASLFSALLTAVRSNGLFILVYYGYELAKDAWTSWRERRPLLDYLQENSAKLLPAIFTPLGLFLFWHYSFAVSGDAFAQKSTASYGWSREMGLPFHVFPKFFAGSANALYATIGSLLIFGASFTLLSQKLYKDFAYCLANFLLFYSASIYDSMLRYSIALFPIYLGLALFVKARPRGRIALFATFAAAFLFTAYAWYERLSISI